MELCETYQQCKYLDGRLIINRTLDGPALTLEEGLPLGPFSLHQPMLRPFAKLVFEQKWIPKEMCYGPVRSVMGLAPCESITTELRTVQQQEFTSLVQRAMESSEVTTNTRLEGRELVDTNWDGNTIDLSKVTVGEWGSWWEIGGAVVGGLLGGPIGAGVGAWVGGAIDDATSGSGGGGAPTTTGRVLTIIDETLETVQKSESQHVHSETSSSTLSVRERSITRTFKNPYLNRSLELRFIPTFRRFEIVTTMIRFDFGLSLDVGRVAFPRLGVGAANGDFLQARLKDQRIMSVANAELGLDDEFASTPSSNAVAAHLNANPEIYAKKLVRHMHQNRDIETLQAPVLQAIRNATKDPKEAENLEKALAWSNTYVQDKSIFVPVTDPSLALERLNLPKDLAADLDKKVKKIKPGALKKITTKRDVHLFAGTHVEAVPGKCKLPGLPNFVKSAGGDEA